jgi:hypothetical protein
MREREGLCFRIEQIKSRTLREAFFFLFIFLALRRKSLIFSFAPEIFDF